MYTKEELDVMAKHAKEKLSKNANVDDNEEVVDIYKELREECTDEKAEEQREEISIKTHYDGEFIRGQNSSIRSEPTDEELQTEHEILSYDEPLFVGGPTKTQLESWKKQWADYDIFVTEIQEQYFIFRTLNRFEYKQIVALQNVDALQREEIICETVTLFPANYKWDKMAKDKAGIPSTYSQIIMEKSGFTNEYAIEVL